jgi:exosome complex RNA-binding protein Rrp42 (RNase PH superfamily)
MRKHNVLLVLGCEDFRSITVDSNIFPQVNGSSRVRIGDSVDVICSVKADVTEPSNDAPSRGILSVDVEISPVCKIGLNEDSTLIDTDLIADSIEKSMSSSKAFPWEQLCIVPGHHVWTIYVDLLVLQMHEDVTTACSIATFVALNNVVIPKTYPKKGNDFDIEGDITLASHLHNAIDLPILLPIAKIGKAVVVDVTDSEIECASSVMNIGIDRRGKVVSFSITGDKAVEVTEMENALQMATVVGSGIFTYLSRYCQTQLQNELENNFPYLAVTSPGLKV